MIAMAHRLHAIGAAFEMHYSCSRRRDAGFHGDLAAMPWADSVQLHFSDQGTRADLDALLKDYRDGYRLYTCGPDRYMSAALEAGERNGWPDNALHREYFSIPENPDYENHGLPSSWPGPVKLSRWQPARPPPRHCWQPACMWM